MKTKKNGPAWWRAFGWRPGRRRPGGGIDFADMGTVVGLDASLAASDDGKPVDRWRETEATEARQRSPIDRLNGRSVR